MTTPEPRPNSFIEGHAELDERLAAAFRDYDQAFAQRLHAPHERLVRARLNLSLLLWQDDDVPAQVGEQLAVDGDELLRDTPPL